MMPQHACLSPSSYVGGQANSFRNACLAIITHALHILNRVVYPVCDYIIEEQSEVAQQIVNVALHFCLC